MKWLGLILAALLLAGCAKQIETKTTTVRVYSGKQIIHPSGIITQARCLTLKLGTSYADILHQYGWPADPSSLALDSPSDTKVHQYQTLDYPTDKSNGIHCTIGFDDKGNLNSKGINAG